MKNNKESGVLIIYNPIKEFLHLITNSTTKIIYDADYTYISAPSPQIKNGEELLKENYALVEIKGFEEQDMENINKNIISQNKHYMTILARMLILAEDFPYELILSDLIRKFDSSSFRNTITEQAMLLNDKSKLPDKWSDDYVENKITNLMAIDKINKKITDNIHQAVPGWEGNLLNEIIQYLIYDNRDEINLLIASYNDFKEEYNPSDDLLNNIWNLNSNSLNSSNDSEWPPYSYNENYDDPGTVYV